MQQLFIVTRIEKYPYMKIYLFPKKDRILIVVYKLFSAFQYANFLSSAHTIFYIILRQILIKSAAFHVIWYPKYSSYVFWISNKDSKHEDTLGIFR